MNAWAPIILGERQEQFCQQVIAGKPFYEAYRIAYGGSTKAAEANSSRLIRSDRVKARIEQIRAHNAAAERVSVPFLTRELYAIAAEARAAGQLSAAQACMMGVAKLHGLLIERHMIDAVVRKPSATTAGPDEMNEASWLQEFGAVIEHSIDPQPDGES